MSKVALTFLFTARWELYLGFLVSGVISAFGISNWIREGRWVGPYGFLVRFVLYFAAISALLAVALTFAHPNDSTWARICFMAMRFAWFFVDGVLLAALTRPGVIRGASAPDDGLMGMLLLPHTIWAAQLSLASQYLSAGSLKFLTRETLDFFQMSGYSAVFFFFIAAWEVLWGLGVLFRRTALLSLTALSIGMFGAIYTHYHNYFTRGVPGPLGNSVDAFRMLFLMAYVAFALKRQQHHQGDW